MVEMHFFIRDVQGRRLFPAIVQSEHAVFMNALASLRRHPVYRDALICQLVAFVLTAGIDGLEHFLTSWCQRGFSFGFVSYFSSDFA